MKLKTRLCSIAQIAAVSAAMYAGNTFAANPQTDMGITNLAPGFTVSVTANLMCGADATQKKTKNFPQKNIQPDGVEVRGTWKDCRLLPAEYYEGNTAPYNQMLVKLTRINTGDTVVVKLNVHNGHNIRQISFAGYTFNLQFMHNGYAEWNEYGHVLRKNITAWLLVE